MQPTIDINTPFMQQMLRNNPNMLAQLGLTPTGAIQPPTPALTAEMVSQMIDERLKAVAPPAIERLAGISAQFEQVFQAALPKEDYEAFHAYVANGSPGFDKLLAGDTLHPIAQLLWETIKESTK